MEEVRGSEVAQPSMTPSHASPPSSACLHISCQVESCTHRSSAEAVHHQRDRKVAGLPTKEGRV
jgi:hypothetical protein